MRAGGLEAIRDALDRRLRARRADEEQGPIWLGLADGVTSLRAYPRLRRHRGDGRALRLSPQLRYSYPRLVCTVAWHGPGLSRAPVLLLFGDPAAQAAAFDASALMVGAFIPICAFTGFRRLRLSPCPASPPAIRGSRSDRRYNYWRGAGGLWKGRLQAPAKKGV